MRTKLEKRMEQLKDELDAGQKMLAELEERKANLTTTLLRIQGAIQVLEELLNPEEEEHPTEGDSTAQ